MNHGPIVKVAIPECRAHCTFGGADDIIPIRGNFNRLSRAVAMIIKDAFFNYTSDTVWHYPHPQH